MVTIVNFPVFCIRMARSAWRFPGGLVLDCPNIAEQKKPMPLPPLLRLLALVVVMTAGPMLTARPADAHAVIIDSIPAVDAVVPAGDSDVTLRFNSRIDHQRSRLTLVAPDGMASLLAISPDSEPDIVAAKMSGLAAGQYRLRWQVLAIDGHLTRGDIRFSVKAP
jgi:copper resistance protein C